MGDPELVARAQRAAERLERSWDRWRRLHGLAAEKAQPVSSYVGYSLAEPWGRPRVVFGVGAEEAERLSALLEQDAGTDPRFSQGLLWEPGSSAQPQSGEHTANGAQPSANGQAPVNGTVLPVNGTELPANGGQLAGNGGQHPGNRAQLPEPRVPEEPQAGPDAEPAPGAPATEWAKTMPTFQPAPPEGTEAMGSGVPQSFKADLASWTSGELPGQASAGLVAWPSADRQGEGTDRAAARPMPGGTGARDAAPRTPEVSDGSPDAASWLRLA